MARRRTEREKKRRIRKAYGKEADHVLVQCETARSQPGGIGIWVFALDQPS